LFEGRSDTMEELKKAILEFAQTNKKTKFYFSDMEKGVKEKIPDAKTRDIKKAATELVNEEQMIYFSTGSSTMYGLKGRGQTEDH
jgi:hypothetical protein